MNKPEELENERGLTVTKKPSKYIDDMTLYMAWQNYHLINYSYWSSCYHASMFQAFGINQQTFPTSSQYTSYSQSQYHHHQQQRQQTMQNPVQYQQPPENRVVKLASIQKRIIAEAVDFLILAVVKAITIMYLYGDDYMKHFEFLLTLDDNMQKGDLEWMLGQAMIYRLLIVVYEGYLISGTMPFSRGQTIGKSVVGIKVVYCTNVEDVNFEEQLVRIQPYAVGAIRSCFRSLLKNMAISLLFPLFLPVLVFNHNRLVYDFAVDTLVIEKKLPVQ